MTAIIRSRRRSRFFRRNADESAFGKIVFQTDGKEIIIDRVFCQFKEVISVVELEPFKYRLASYREPLQEVRDSL